jgi:hypothetical protein
MGTASNRNATGAKAQRRKMFSRHKGLLCLRKDCQEKVEHANSMTWCAKHLEERNRIPVAIQPLGDVDREIYGKVQPDTTYRHGNKQYVW